MKIPLRAKVVCSRVFIASDQGTVDAYENYYVFFCIIQWDYLLQQFLSSRSLLWTGSGKKMFKARTHANITYALVEKPDFLMPFECLV